MNKTEAMKVAQKHIDLLNSTNPQKVKFKWELPEPMEVNGGWYFDYEFEILNDEDMISIEGAPGFMVSKDNSKVEDVTWERYHDYNLALQDQYRHWL